MSLVNYVYVLFVSLEIKIKIKFWEDIREL